MINARRKKVLFWASIISFVLLAGIALFRGSTPDHVQLNVRVLSVKRFSNGLMQVSLELSNSGPRLLNVAADRTGSPALVLEVPGRTKWIHRPDSSGGISLGATNKLTTLAWVTNPPSRFRLHFHVRDSNAEAKMDSIRRLLPTKTLQSSFTKWRREQWEPSSPWIE